MDLPLTFLSLPLRLPYPLTVQRIHASRNSTVTKTQVLLTYSYLPPNPDEHGNRERQVRAWESPVAGEVVSWAVRGGDTIRDHKQALVQIKEPCTHDVQLHGLCALCGKDLNAVDYTGFSDTSRATISMVHDVGGLTVSREEAHRLETATTTRLLSTKKLSLIVDLDQTIVHATVDPTVGEWLQDPSNPNYGALEGVKRFKLVDEDPARRKKPSTGGKGKGREGDEIEEESEEEDDEDGCWYYIKMRHGLADFLKRVAETYEMHVYTMGTRAYAIEVCKVIDPDGGLFGGRILSRDESGSMTRKSLQRLFPCDTNMVVIIDDRADVWDGSPNLVKVIPYEFFVGIGDINAAFLPKKKELVPPPVPAPPPASPPLTTATAASDSPSPFFAESPTSTGEAGGKTTTPTTSPEPDEHGVPTSVASEPVTISDLVVDSSPSTLVSPSISEASTAAALTIHDVIEARPLEKAQKEADELHHLQHAQAHSHPSPSPVSDKGEMNGSVAVDGEVRKDVEVLEDEVYEEEAVLKDDDRELDRVFDILTTVHARFFDAHSAQGAADVANIIPALKQQALRSCHLVFSGLVALGTKPEDSEYWKLAKTFGARCSTDLQSGVTHLVANQAGTAKVHSARRNPRIKLVYPQWLLDSVAHWTRLPEESYLLPDPESTSPPGSPIRPELSDGDDDLVVAKNGSVNGKGKERALDLDSLGDAGGGGETEPEDEGDLELADVDWGDAMREVDDLLDETDDEDTASLLDGEGGDGGAESDTGSVASAASSRPRKRPRVSSVPSIGGGDQNGGDAAGKPTESPLQKRIKTAQNRKSGLNRSMSAAALAKEAAAPSPPPPAGNEGGSSGITASSQASSVDSDDEDLLALLGEVEKGFS